MTEEKWVVDGDGGRNGGDDEDSRWGWCEGRKRGMTTGRRARRRLQGVAGTSSQRKIKRRIRKMGWEGEVWRGGTVPHERLHLLLFKERCSCSAFCLRPAGGSNPAVCVLDAHATKRYMN